MHMSNMYLTSNIWLSFARDGFVHVLWLHVNNHTFNTPYRNQFKMTTVTYDAISWLLKKYSWMSMIAQVGPKEKKRNHTRTAQRTNTQSRGATSVLFDWRQQ